MFFSIVIPIYNVSKFVRRGVECILAQDFDDFELILVDDGSTDGSGTLCDREAAMCSKIKGRRLPKHDLPEPDDSVLPGIRDTGRGIPLPVP